MSGRVLQRWDVALPLLLAAAAQVELHLPHSTEAAPATAGHAALLAVVVLPLMAQRRAPLLAPAAAAAAWAVEPLFFPVANTFAVPLAVLGLAPLAAARWAPTTARAWAASVLVVALLALQGATHGVYGVGGSVANAVFGSALAVVGGVWRRHAEQRRQAEERAAAERVAREEADRALAAERARIARELHDVVGHGLSVVVLQARGARRVLDADPDRAREALDEVERIASRSLHEMRLLMGVLRLPAGAPVPQPGLADLPELVGGVRAAGTPVVLRLPAPLPDLPAAVGVSCYRIVQEALTNALRHAPGGAVRVDVCCAGGSVVLEVLTAAPAASAGAPVDHGGSGLLGVRERVELFGGRLHAGPLPDGGHRLHASLPLPCPGQVDGPAPAQARDGAGRVVR
ncbi:sensor histidine kinase [Kineococcus xinjiangensis]|uniref:sensor histidine kinase n=1 Tax=Kineococcus xinjiangensis TaxID=512762 RepID=UPI001304B485|nr:histidine kinase [Kineococcus xinjiangensis]